MLCVVLNGLLLGFALTFFPWHCNGGRETAQIDLKTIQMFKKNQFQCDYTQILLNATDRSRLAAIGCEQLGLFFNLILHNRTISDAV